MKYNIKGLD